MASIEDYNAKLDVITAIPESETKSPNMPVKAFLEEAEFLYKRANEDKDALLGAGLDFDLVQDFCRYAPGLYARRKPIGLMIALIRKKRPRRGMRLPRKGTIFVMSCCMRFSMPIAVMRR
jgi:hypothetical protein